ncbi:hypothetical protein EJB05_37942, partial [Eragrostis curvula]
MRVALRRAMLAVAYLVAAPRVKDTPRLRLGSFYNHRRRELKPSRSPEHTTPNTAASLASYTNTSFPQLIRAHPMRRRAATMMNLVAIGLVISTLAAAGVWSPAPPQPQPPAAQQHPGERRVVIVEYEREADGTVKETRVLSSRPLEEGEDGARVLEEARGAVTGAAEKITGTAEDAKDSATGGVLGAVKRCKDRLCGAGRSVEEGAEDAARRAKETVTDAKDSAENKAFDAAQRGKQTLESAKGKASGAASLGKETLESAKDKASGAASQGKEAVKGKVSEAAGKAKEKASDLEHGAFEAARNAKDKVSEEARNVKHGAKDTVRGARDKVSDMAERAEEYAHDAAESAADKAAEAEEAVKAKAGEVRKNLTDIARRARDVASDAAAYLLGGPLEAARTATAVMHLLGFAAAFGTCVWVTFMSSYVLAAALPRQQLGMLQSKMYPVYFRAMAYGVGLALASHLLGAERSSLASRAQSVNLIAALGLVLANMLLFEPKATKVMFERMKVEKEEGRGQDMADIVDPPAVTVSTVATYAAAAARAEAAAARTPADAAAATGKAATPATTGKAKATATTGDAEMSKSRVLLLNKRLKTLNSYSSLCNVLSLMALSWHLVHLARRLLPGTAC